MRRLCALVFAAAGLVTLVACNSTPTTPTPTSTPPTSAIQVFSGSIVPGDTPSFTFGVPATSPLHIMFGSLTSLTGVPLGSTVRLALGLQNATTGACDVLTSVSTTAALRAQINVVASAGSYCAKLIDTSSVSAAANFAVRLVYGTPSDADSSGTITYDSTVAPSGSTSRTFAVGAAGTATIIMDVISPASVSALGLGLGFARQDGSGCELAFTTSATRGSQFAAQVDAGKYCVKVFDPGTLIDVTNFTIRIVHP